MKTIKIISSLLIAGVVMTSCNDKVNNEDTAKLNVSDNTEIKLTNESGQLEEKRQMEVMTKEYAMKDGSEISYTYTEDGVTSLRDWDAYNIMSYEMGEIENANFKTTNKRITNLYGTVMSLGETIPAWLKTEEVMEDITDIQKEYKEYLEEKNASANERQENLEELNEQFADLREELNETIDEYLKINQEAIAKFNKKLEKGKLDKAIEKFNNKMDEKEKIADYEEKNNK
ncbi:hypothetical protein ACFQ1Q_08190 [Winogradskyella litorisediminis]|uniref:YD repeat-containing protein n=1 Tax=Winogradskyella litorisediminis TaxID=1156618 RepID=A0ABW3N9F0_9FLAO